MATYWAFEREKSTFLPKLVDARLKGRGIWNVSQKGLTRVISSAFSRHFLRKAWYPPSTKSSWRHVGLVGSRATHLQQTCKQARCSMSRFNNQLPCKPLSNAEFCKVQLICYRNERLANCNSPQPVHLSVCLLWEPEGQENEKQQQPESDANSLGTILAVLVRASMKSVCVCIDVGVRMAQQERNVWGDHFKPEDKDASAGWSSYIPSNKHQYNEK